MLVYTGILFMALMITYFFREQVKNYETGEVIFGIKKSGLFLLAVLFVFFFACRWYVGTDFPNYYRRYFLSGNANILSLIGGRDWGFYTLTAIIYKIWPQQYIKYSIIIGLIIYIPVILTYREIATNYCMTICLYVSMCLYTWPYNGTRQAIAVGIMFCAAVRLNQDNKIGRFLALAVVAFLFHATAVFIIPFILAARSNAWGKKIVIPALMVVISVIILPRIWTYVIGFLEFVGQDKMAEDYGDLVSLRAGINILRIIVAVLPLIIAYLFRIQIQRHYENYNFVTNMCLLNFVFLLCAYRITNLSRFAAYFNLYLAAFVPEIKHIFNERSKRISNVTIFILYYLHMLILLPNDSGLVPYQFIFNR